MTYQLRPLLDVDDLDARPEWEQGRRALLAYVSEMNLPHAGPAQWLHSEMLISVELAYGSPVIVFEGGGRRRTLPLVDADSGRLRAVGLGRAPQYS